MKLLEPLTVKNVTFKNRIMFPPLTTGYEEKDSASNPFRSILAWPKAAPPISF